MAKYRVGIIGTGRKGATIDDEFPPGHRLLPFSHAAAYQQVKEVEVVAAANRSREKLEAFGTRYGVRSLYTDHEEMLAKERLDIVSVTTQARERAQCTIAAARAGVKGIIAEKAMATSLEEADAIIRACEENGVKLIVNHTRRWNTAYREAKRLLDSGAIGELRDVSGIVNAALIHNGTHMFDILRYYAGDIQWVFGHLDVYDPKAFLHQDKQDLSGSGYLRFQNGVVGFVDMEKGLGWEVRLYGSQGRLIIEELGAPPLAGELVTYRVVPSPDPKYSKGGKRVKVPHKFSPPPQGKSEMVLCIEDMIHWIETGEPSVSTGYDGRAALEAALAFHQSAREGCKRVPLPLEDRKLRVVNR